MKVGDLVVIKRLDEEEIELYKDYMNKLTTISKVSSTKNACLVKLDDGKYWWFEDEIEIIHIDDLF